MKTAQALFVLSIATLGAVQDTRGETVYLECKLPAISIPTWFVTINYDARTVRLSNRPVGGGWENLARISSEKITWALAGTQISANPANQQPLYYDLDRYTGILRGPDGQFQCTPTQPPSRRIF
jgi:hypothetical protein